MEIILNKQQVVGFILFEGGQMTGVTRRKEKSFFKPAGYYYQGKLVNHELLVQQGTHAIINGELEAKPMLKILLSGNKFMYRYFDSKIIMGKYIEEHFSNILSFKVPPDEVWWNNFM